MRTIVARWLTRSWRVAFVIYALTLTVATHWPSLDVSTASYAAPDQPLHMIAFGGLVALLALTRWLGAMWQAALLGLVWAAVDEWSQALPILNRHAMWQDMVAGQLGVVLVWAWWWAVAPVGALADRQRHEQGFAVVDELFASLRTWIVVGLVSVVAGVAAAGVAAAVLVRLGAGEDLLSWLVIAGVAGAGTAGLLVVARLARRERPGARPRPLSWLGVGKGVLAATGVLVAAAMLTLVPSGWGAMATDMRLAFGVTILGLAAAVAVRVYARSRRSSEILP